MQSPERLPPLMQRVLNRVRRLGKATDHATQVFSEIRTKNVWGDDESVSGPGSSLGQTAAVRRELPTLLRELGARSLLDIPCGDFNWMRHVDLGLEQYIGADIVKALIQQNQQRYGGPNRKFVLKNAIKDPLPAVDVIFCRDCLVHFTYENIHLALANFRRTPAQYLLTTTFPAAPTNRDIPMGSWRPLNLQLPPFNLPAPLRLINEACTENDGQYADKSLALWRLADL